MPVGRAAVLEHSNHKSNAKGVLEDPFKFGRVCWPDMQFFHKQKQVIESVIENEETIVPAGNMLGKDFVAGFITIWFFCRFDPVRIITTSVKDDHLRVLWGEIGRFLQSSVDPLLYSRGGSLILTHREMRKVIKGDMDKFSYCKGQVSEKGEGMAGHHAKHTLAIFDEASGIDDVTYTQACTWAQKRLIIGNPNPCTNFFYHSCKKGDVKAEDNGHYYRKVIRIKATDSPNVQLGMELDKLGWQGARPEKIIPGLLDHFEYKSRRSMWDERRQCVGLDAEFYEGAEVKMFPPIWLNRAENIMPARANRSTRKTLGIDPAEGGDKSCWAVVDDYGLIKLISMKTPDTSIIPNHTIALMKEFNIEPQDVLFDRGGGGKEHADVLRSRGYNVRTIAFGEQASNEKLRYSRRRKTQKQQWDDAENRYVFKNRRAELYGSLRYLLDPSKNDQGFHLPRDYTELREQLEPIPLMFDGEGRLVLPPKNKTTANSTVQTLVEMIGHSPDEADALCLATYGLLNPGTNKVAHAMW